MLSHVPSIGSCSQFCLILQPHRVAVPFNFCVAMAEQLCSNPWQNNFVEGSEQADLVLSQDFEVRGQPRILWCEVVEGVRERGTRHLLNKAKI